MHPTTPIPPPKARGKGRHRGAHGRISVVRVARVKTPLTRPTTATTTETDASTEQPSAGAVNAPTSSGKFKGFSRAAQSIISLHKLQPPTPTDNEPQSPTRQKQNDPWAAVMKTVVRKVTGDIGLNLVSNGSRAATPNKRVSLAQMLKSREMKNLVKEALDAKQLGRAVPVPEEQSQVMAHWVKLSTLRKKQLEPDEDGSARGDFGGRTDNNHYADEEEEYDIPDDVDGVRSAFDLDDSSKSHHMYGRTLILEESCRRALAQDSEQRSQMDLQALGAWFQMTKLKITTDFERLQPSELDLLCRRMTCVTFHPDETIFRQGDEGDALYIVFSGTVDVRVSQRILGEVVEVTVCELTKGDYFGERSLLNNDVRAATVIAKTATELVKITRNDYNLMLKNDQLEFLSRMQIANGVGVHRPVQRTQREYVKVLSKKKYTRNKTEIDMLSEYVQTLKFFRSLPKSFVRELCVVVDFLTIPVGACVFREGEVGDQFYIIFSGSVDVNISSKDFRGNVQQTKLVNLTEGSHFGELALMKGRGIRSATVVTREECQLLVICEKDYNATLRRMQKKDMAKRVGVLDQIPMFQTPEWTGELLKELSYVLLEQKLSTGSVLYRQGERASHVYFVVRGELGVAKEIVDPLTNVKHEVFVERIGRFRVVGDDAAAGANFNEVIHREVTVSASTPVEVLLLSKYDVFHRLSRSARETLRAAAQSHSETIVYLDRFHKTQKWEAYKQKVLREHVNHERIEKILPAAATAMRNVGKGSNSSAPVKSLQVRHATTSKAESKSSPGKVEPSREPDKTTEISILPPLPVPPPTKDDKSSCTTSKVLGISAKHALVPANELLLLPQEAQAMKKCFNPEQTMGHYVASFNADAPPSSGRQRQLDGVLAAEDRRQAEILKEGNPLAFFGITVVEKHPGSSWNRTAKTTEGSEDRDINCVDSVVKFSGTASPSRQASTIVRSSSKSLTINSQALSQLLQENFIFSRPMESKSHGHDARRSRLLQLKGNQRDAVRGMSFSPPKSLSPSRAYADRIQSEHVYEGDYILFCIRSTSNNEDSGAKRSPAFQIVQYVQSIGAAYDAVERLQEDTSLGSAKYFILQPKAFALMPRPERSKADEDRLQLEQINENVSSKMSGSSNQKTKAPASPAVDESTSSLPSLAGDLTVNFTSFQEVVISPVTSMKSDGEVRAAMPGTTADTTEKPQSSPVRSTSQQMGEMLRKRTFKAVAGNAVSARSTFAVASVVLSKLEVAHSRYEEPFVSVHALFLSEMEAVTFAMNQKISYSLKSAMLCVFPVGKWLRLENAHDWCVQVEPNRREKRAPSFSGAPGAMSPTQTASRRSTKRLLIVPTSPKPIWQQNRDEAKRLHQFICARMGVPVQDKKKDRTEESGGFTPMPLVSLEDKLDTLHDYLQSTASLTSRPGGVAMLKYRQVKRFGSIMRSRIAGALPRNNNNNNNSLASPSPRSSFSTVVTG